MRQDKAREDDTRQDKGRHEKAQQNKTRQSKTRKDRKSTAGQGKEKHDRQNKARLFTRFVDQFLYLLIQVLLASGQGLGPAVPEHGEVLLLVRVQAFLQLGAHGQAADVHRCDALTDQW